MNKNEIYEFGVQWVLSYGLMVSIGCVTLREPTYKEANFTPGWLV